MWETRPQIFANVVIKKSSLCSLYVFTKSFSSFAYCSEFRQFTVEIIQESFLCLPQQPANLTSVSLLNKSCY